jgi:hypothetical protein
MIELHGWLTVIETPGDEDQLSQKATAFSPCIPVSENDLH